MYCYTPHAYNNPNGLYGHPKYGNKGLYYSGSYNFVLWFERWFGSTRSDTGLRLIVCDGDKYLVERFIQRKRVVNDSAIDEWGFDYSYITEGDKGCSYPTYDAQLERIMRSRKTQKLYLVDNTKAYWIPDHANRACSARYCYHASMGRIDGFCLFWFSKGNSLASKNRT